MLFNWTKQGERWKFSKKSAFPSYIQHKNRKEKQINTTYLVSVRCSEAGPFPFASLRTSNWHKIRCIVFFLFFSVEIQLLVQYLAQVCTAWAVYPSGLTFTWWGRCGLCFWNKPTELAHSFLFCYVYFFSFVMALSTVFHFINFPVNFPLSHSVLQVLFCLCWSFQLYISIWKSPLVLI